MDFTAVDPAPADVVLASGLKCRLVHINKRSLCLDQTRPKLKLDLTQYWDHVGNGRWGTIGEQHNVEPNWDFAPEFPYSVPAALFLAFKSHADVLLSPDDVWTQIMHGFALHVAKNSEKLRSLFVSHTGKMLISVIVPVLDFSMILAGFNSVLATEVKGDLAKKLESDFSTTGPIEKAVSSVFMLTTMKTYFAFSSSIACGIRNVYLAGTLADWQKLSQKLEQLRPYDFGWAVDRLQPVVAQFVATYQGKVDLGFWNAVLRREHAIGSGYLSDSKVIERLTGWVAAFFPYDYRGKATASGEIDIANLPATVFKVPMKVDEIAMKYLAGFVGMQYENETFRPCLGVAVAKKLRDKASGERGSQYWAGVEQSQFLTCPVSGLDVSAGEKSAGHMSERKWVPTMSQMLEKQSGKEVKPVPKGYEGMFAGIGESL